VLATALAAQQEAFAAYQANPSQETFLAAQQQFAAQLAQDETNAQAMLMLGWLYQMESLRMTEWFAGQADDLQPGMRFGWANLMLAQGRYEEAIAQYDILNEASPAWSCPWRHKGQALYSCGRYAEAETALGKAIETRVEHYDAYVWLAKTQHAQGRDAEALATLETGFTYLGEDIEDPAEEVDDVEVKKLYADLLEANGRAEEAAEIRANLQQD